MLNTVSIGFIYDILRNLVKGVDIVAAIFLLVCADSASLINKCCPMCCGASAVLAKGGVGVAVFALKVGLRLTCIETVGNIEYTPKRDINKCV